MAIEINLIVDQGAKFEGLINVLDENGNPLDLTDTTPHCHMRRSYSTSTFFAIPVIVDGDPMDGNIKLTILPSLSNTIPPQRYVYDVEIHNDLDAEDVRRAVQGIITITPNVTKV